MSTLFEVRLAHLFNLHNFNNQLTNQTNSRSQERTGGGSPTIELGRAGCDDIPVMEASLLCRLKSSPAPIDAVDSLAAARIGGGVALAGCVELIVDVDDGYRALVVEVADDGYVECVG